MSSNAELHPEDQEIFENPEDARVFRVVARNLIHNGVIATYSDDGELHHSYGGAGKRPLETRMPPDGVLSASDLEGAEEYVSLLKRDAISHPSEERTVPGEKPHSNAILRAIGITVPTSTTEWVTGDPVRHVDERIDAVTGQKVPFSVMRYSFGFDKPSGGDRSRAIRRQGMFGMAGGVPTAEGEKLLDIAKIDPHVVRRLGATVRAAILGREEENHYPTRYEAVPDDWPLIIATKDANADKFTTAAARIGNKVPSPVKFKKM